jgi:hypothetical protein
MRRLSVLASFVLLAGCELNEPELLVTPSAVVFDAVGDTVAATTVFTGTSLAGPGAAIRRWATRDASIARVTSDGGIVSIGNGETEITLTAFDRVVSVPVRVQQVAATLEVGPAFVPTASPLRVGQTLQGSARAVDRRGNPVRGDVVTWRSLTPGILAVSGTGLATALASGAGVMQARVGDLTAELVVSVVP